MPAQVPARTVPTLMPKCSADSWMCRCTTLGECRPAPLDEPTRAPLAPIHRWSHNEVVAFLRSLGPGGSRQTCPNRCLVPSLFSEEAVDRFGRRGLLNGSALLQLLRISPSPPMATSSHAWPGETASIMFFFQRRLMSALRHEAYNRPEAVWLGGAEGAPQGGRAHAIASLAALVRAGWTARVFMPRAEGARFESLDVLANSFPSSVEFMHGFACANEAYSVPLYSRVPGADCGGIWSQSLAAERVLAAPGCRAVGSCVSCVRLAATPPRHHRHIGAVFVDAVGAEQALLLHRFLSSPVFDPAFPPRSVRRAYITTATTATGPAASSYATCHTAPPRQPFPASQLAASVTTPILFTSQDHHRSHDKCLRRGD